MGGLKSLIGTRISQFEKEVQRLISTSALVELNLQQSIDQTMKKVVDTNRDEIQAILEKHGQINMSLEELLKTRAKTFSSPKRK